VTGPRFDAMINRLFFRRASIKWLKSWVGFPPSRYRLT
jgi:hypothetical protein